MQHTGVRGGRLNNYYQAFAELDLLCFDDVERRRRRRHGDRRDDRGQGQGQGQGHGVGVGPERLPPHAGRHQVALPLVDPHGPAADGARGHVAAGRGSARRQRLQATAGTTSKSMSARPQRLSPPEIKA